jgi:hypothetical protein
MKKILPILLILLVFSGCKKQVDEKYPEFIGYWHTLNTIEIGASHEIININADGTALYEKQTGVSTTTADGTARANKRKLKVGLKGFKVDQAPSQLFGNYWTMELDGRAFYCDKDVVFYGIYSCNQVSVNVLNNTSDTIVGSFDNGTLVSVAPQSSLYNNICVGCHTTYTDNIGNTLNIRGIVCQVNLEVN